MSYVVSETGLHKDYVQDSVKEEVKEIAKEVVNENYLKYSIR